MSKEVYDKSKGVIDLKSFEGEKKREIEFKSATICAIDPAAHNFYHMLCHERINPVDLFDQMLQYYYPMKVELEERRKEEILKTGRMRSLEEIREANKINDSK